MTRKITKTALRRAYAEANALCQLDLFCDRKGVAHAALRQVREADRLAEKAGIKLRPLIKKRK